MNFEKERWDSKPKRHDIKTFRMFNVSDPELLSTVKFIENEVQCIYKISKNWSISCKESLDFIEIPREFHNHIKFEKWDNQSRYCYCINSQQVIDFVSNRFSVEIN
jgi:hypothetical protein